MEEPIRFIGPTTRILMLDPVLDSSGNCYERKAIQKWLINHDTTPKTNEILPDKKLTPMRDLKADIHSFREEKIKEGLKIFPKLMSKEHFPLAEKLYAFIDKYNVVLKDNFCRKILETLLEVVPGLISAKPPSFE